MDVDKILMVDEEEEFPAIARLVELGRQKGYITLDDIIHRITSYNVCYTKLLRIKILSTSIMY